MLTAVSRKHPGLPPGLGRRWVHGVGRWQVRRVRNKGNRYVRLAGESSCKEVASRHRPLGFLFFMNLVFFFKSYASECLPSACGGKKSFGSPGTDVNGYVG